MEKRTLIISLVVILASITLFAVIANLLILNKELSPLIASLGLPITAETEAEKEHFYGYGQPILPAPTCNLNSQSSVCGSNKNLLPVHEVAFNLREIVKQMLLLEDHLFQDEKQCVECINKHFLTIEALAEEGISLDTDTKYKSVLHQVTIIVRDKQKEFSSSNCNRNKVAQAIRDLRKELMKSL
jgi:hypothetical protein